MCYWKYPRWTLVNCLCSWFVLNKNEKVSHVRPLNSELHRMTLAFLHSLAVRNGCECGFGSPNVKTEELCNPLVNNARVFLLIHRKEAAKGMI